MGFDRLIKRIFTLFLCLIGGIVLLTGCRGEKKVDPGNIYHIELKNSSDSFKHAFESRIVGKASFHKNNKLEVLSTNYITEEYPDIHYFKSMAEIGKEPMEGTKKIQVELAGNLTIDSTFYYMVHFQYRDKQWIKTSDVGFIHAFSTNRMALPTDPFGYSELMPIIVKNVVESTYVGPEKK